MRIEPISLYGGGSSWSSAPVGGVKPIGKLQQLYTEEQRDQLFVRNSEPYKDTTTDLAVSLNNKQVGNYDSSGKMAPYDAFGAVFDMQA
ncbi:MAG: hypothetical protein IK152_02645 [Lachnospiraceae bacterium]|nr:hypothetical protein [Lachnospiraceae bacterium]